MTIRYLRSTDGSNSDDGSTWALAKANAKETVAASTSGDIIYVSQSHAETSATEQTITSAAVPDNPLLIVPGNDAAEPPTATATASVETTGSNAINLYGNMAVSRIAFRAGDSGEYTYTGIKLAQPGTGTTRQEFNNCDFIVRGAHPSSYILIGATGGYSSIAVLNNCGLSLANASSIVTFVGSFVFNGGSMLSGSVTSTSGLFLLGASGVPAAIVFKGFSFSNMSSAFQAVKGDSGNSYGTILLDGCQFPAAWGGALSGTLIHPGSRVEMVNCVSGTTPLPLKVADYAGTIDEETVTILTGGHPVSHKLVSNANTKFSGAKLDSVSIIKEQTAIGSPVTATVEIVIDSVTALTDKDIWLNVEYISDAYGSVAIASSRSASTLATPVNHATSSASWVTTALTNPLKQKLQVTFTPNKAGAVKATVKLAKASTTVYVNPAPLEVA